MTLFAATNIHSVNGTSNDNSGLSALQAGSNKISCNQICKHTGQNGGMANDKYHCACKGKKETVTKSRCNDACVKFNLTFGYLSEDGTQCHCIQPCTRSEDTKPISHDTVFAARARLSSRQRRRGFACCGRNIVPAADWLVSLGRCALSQPDARDNVATGGPSERTDENISRRRAYHANPMLRWCEKAKSGCIEANSETEMSEATDKPKEDASSSNQAPKITIVRNK
ncbi:hypothetical protein Ddc_19457 [Ditylenchus destructor]|nr:hypothetical protein Ddc_19457 [Ditylenchus destructor]